MLVVRKMYLFRFQLVFLFGCSMSFMTAAANHNNEKRLLLNDPDITGRRLAHLESTQRELTNLLSRFNTTIGTLQAENKDLQAKNAAIEVKNAAIETKNVAIETKHAALEAKDVAFEAKHSAFEAKHSDLQSKYTALQSRTMQLESHTAKQDNLIATIQGFGSTYVRWGRTQCPSNDTELVYSGYAAGQQFYHPAFSSRFGGPANTLCLPNNPELDLSHTVSTGNLLYGTEYEGNDFGTNSANEDMPCAVCRRNSLSTTIMIPGRNSCFPGWRMEYNGILAGGDHTHSASSYLCADKIPEYIPSGQKDENGHLFYVIAFKCGPLPCPPYKDNTVVNCVVCSK